MTSVRELVEKTIDFNEVNYVEIICNDYRKCKPMSINAFTRKYKGTDLWYDHAIDYCWSDTDDNKIMLTIAL